MPSEQKTTGPTWPEVALMALRAAVVLGLAWAFVALAWVTK